ncbi:hypothetical protein [Spirosoma jeollabukense]
MITVCTQSATRRTFPQRAYEKRQSPGAAPGTGSDRIARECDLA